MNLSVGGDIRRCEIDIELRASRRRARQSSSPVKAQAQDLPRRRQALTRSQAFLAHAALGDQGEQRVAPRAPPGAGSHAWRTPAAASRSRGRSGHLRRAAWGWCHRPRRGPRKRCAGCPPVRNRQAFARSPLPVSAVPVLAATARSAGPSWYAIAVGLETTASWRAASRADSERDRSAGVSQAVRARPGCRRPRSSRWVGVIIWPVVRDGLGDLLPHLPRSRRTVYWPIGLIAASCAASASAGNTEKLSQISGICDSRPKPKRFVASC